MPPAPKPADGKWDIAAPLLLLGAMLLRFLLRPLAEKLACMPDDGFYYLELGREYARSGIWSFDRGQTLTSGFHLLFAYVAAALEAAFPDAHAVGTKLGILAALATLLTGGGLVLLAGALGDDLRRGCRIALLYVGCAAGVFLLPLQAMEWPLAVLATSAAVYGLAKGNCAVTVAAFFLGPMCRFDFVVPAGCLAIVTLAEWKQLDVRTRRLVLLALSACAVGTAIVCAHTYAISGTLLSASARTKAFWGSVEGYQLGYGFDPASYAFSPFFLFTRTLDFGPATLLVPLGVLIALGVRHRPAIATLSPASRLLFAWSALSIVALAFTYGRVGRAAQCWYSALYVAPLFVVVATLGALLSPRARRIATAVGVVIAAANIWTARAPIGFLAGALPTSEAVAADASLTRIGAWNAGTVGYLGGEKVINLDGLVNDDVIPYLVADRLHCYLVHERIPVIVDRMGWFEPRARILGASDGRFRQNIHPYNLPSAIPGVLGPEAWSVDLEALAKEPDCADDLRSARSKALRPFGHS